MTDQYDSNMQTVNGVKNGEKRHDSTILLNGTKSKSWSDYALLTFVPFLHLFSYLLTLFVINQYTYVYFLEEKYPTVPHGFSGSLAVCTVNTSSLEYLIESDIQKIAATWGIYVNVALSLPSLLINVNLATYSDAYGRKLFFVIPLIGSIIKNLLCVLGVYLKINVRIFLAFYIVEASTASWVGTIAMAFCYIADTTQPGKRRSFLIGMLEGGIGVGLIIASFISGYLITWTKGYIYPLNIATALLVGAFIVVLFFIDETLEEPNRRKRVSFFANMKRVFDVYRPNFSSQGKQWQYIVLIFMFVCSGVANISRSTVEGLYFIDSPFCWSSITIGIYTALRTISWNIGAIVLIKICHAWTNDEVIALIGMVTTTVCLLLEGLAKTNAMLYISAAAGFGCIVTMPMVRAIMSRMTEPDKQGSVFAGVAAVEAFCSLVGTVLIGIVYDATIDIYKGMTFLIWTAFSIIGIVLSVILIKRSPKTVRQPEIAVSVNQ